MIAKPYRFDTRFFKRCFKRSKKFRTPSFLFLLSPNKRQKASFAVVVNKKYSKSAVKRNRLRRQSYEIIRKRCVPHITDFNVICLYTGDKNEQNSQKLLQSFNQLKGFLKRKSKNKPRPFYQR